MAIVNDLLPDSIAVPSNGDAGNDGRPFIQVNAVWKAFGKEPDKVLEPQFADKDKSFFQTEMGTVIGLQDVSFEVGEGQTFVIMGLSGSGKSTMVRCLTRLIEPTAGDITIDGENVTSMSDKELIDFRRNKVAMVFQHYGLMPHRNVLDNAGWGLEIQGVPRKNGTPAPARCWNWWDSQDGRKPTPANYPAVCSNELAWPGRWRSTPASC